MDTTKRSRIGKRRRSSSRKSFRNVRSKIPYEPELVEEHLRDEYTLYHLLINNELFGNEMERKQAMELLRDYVRTQCRQNNVSGIDCDSIMLERLRPSVSRRRLQGGVLSGIRRATRAVGEKISVAKSSFIAYLKESKERFASNVLRSIIRIGAHILVIGLMVAIGQLVVGNYENVWLASLISNIVNYMPEFGSLWKLAWSYVIDLLKNQVVYEGIKSEVSRFLVFTVLLGAIYSMTSTFLHNAGIREKQKRILKNGQLLSPNMIEQPRQYFTELKKDATGIYESKYAFGIRLVIGIFVMVAKGLKKGITAINTMAGVSADVAVKAYDIYTKCVDYLTEKGVWIVMKTTEEVDVQLYKFTRKDLNEMVQMSKDVTSALSNFIRETLPHIYEELEKASEVFEEEFIQASSRFRSKSKSKSRSGSKSSYKSMSQSRSSSGSKSSYKSVSQSRSGSKSPIRKARSGEPNVPKKSYRRSQSF